MHSKLDWVSFAVQYFPIDIQGHLLWRENSNIRMFAMQYQGVQSFGWFEGSEYFKSTKEKKNPSNYLTFFNFTKFFRPTCGLERKSKGFPVKQLRFSRYFFGKIVHCMAKSKDWIFFREIIMFWFPSFSRDFFGKMLHRLHLDHFWPPKKK